MRTFLARRALRAFGRRYDYDVSYLAYLLKVSPRGFFGFRPVMALARHREAAPRDAAGAAKPQLDLRLPVIGEHPDARIGFDDRNLGRPDIGMEP